MDNPFSGWDLDRAFIDNVKFRAATFDLVTFDIFDTVLSRVLDSPADVFALVEHRLLQAGHRFGQGFAQAREDAEVAARQLCAGRGMEEVRLSDIYEVLSRRMHYDPEQQRLAQDEELACEAEVLVAVPDTLEIIRELRSEGREFSFVSDMYLPSSFLEQVLRMRGVDGWRDLFVSSDVGRTKWSGGIWDVVKPTGKTILHIGDDLIADGTRPRERGVDTLLYQRAKSQRRVGAQLTSAVVPFSKLARRHEVQARNPGQEVSKEQQMRALGGSLGVVLVGSFVRWLKERCAQHGVDVLYFCARDGWLLHEAWKASGIGQGGPKAHYLEIARRPLNLASAFLSSGRGELSPRALEYLAEADGEVTVERALRRVGVLDEPAVARDARSTFTDLHEVLTWPHGADKLKALLQRHTSVVLQQLESAYTDVAAYLEQEGVFSSRCAIVDLGWHGNIQRCISELGRAKGKADNVRGFYYGLWPAAQANIYVAGYMEAAFASPFAPLRERPGLQTSVNILEELHTAPIGTVLSYRRSEGRVEPVYAENALEGVQYERFTRHFQEGCIEGIRRVFEGKSDVSADDLGVDAARAAVDAVFLSPSEEELNALRSIGHTYYDHSAFVHEPNSTPQDYNDALRSFEKATWKIGVLRGWLKDPSAASLARQVAREGLSHYHFRCLRQFQ